MPKICLKLGFMRMIVDAQITSISQLTFDNRFVNELPADPETRNFTRQVYGASYSKVLPTKVAKPQVIAYSKEVAALLDLSGQFCQSQAFAEVFAGNLLLPGMEPHATCYGGHQFGNWAGQLGDGRAINLGDVINQRGERWALQLKGAGLTPYSRNADGLAVLRSSLREYLCSEAMHHLGVPTTRALSLTLTGEDVVRDMFYNGNPKSEPGAIVCRVAESFVRFGHFQICTAQGNVELLRKLIDYVISTHFSHLGKPSVEVYLAWFEAVCKNTADLMVEWERVGFVHGVMNTDNMSILGLTIDYGPYGWLENYDTDWTPNTTDAGERRYRFGNQAACAQWNLWQLANAIYPLIKNSKSLKNILADFVEVFESRRSVMYAKKLGLYDYNQALDEKLQADLLDLLQAVQTDMTIFFRKLAQFDLVNFTYENSDNAAVISCFEEAYYDFGQINSEYINRLVNWLTIYQRRVLEGGITEVQRRELMSRVNPKYVLRNYLAQLAIDNAEQGNFTMIHDLMDVLRKPYDEQLTQQQYSGKRPDWARHRPGCSMLSCSS